MAVAAVVGDGVTVGGGVLLPGTCATSVLVGGKAIAINKNVTAATPDSKCDPLDDPSHCFMTGPAGGSSSVLAEGTGVHRDGDKRGCGDVTAGTGGSVDVG